jgi:hypothetical protein
LARSVVNQSSSTIWLAAFIASLAISAQAQKTGVDQPIPSVSPSSQVGAASLQQKAIEAQTRIRVNRDDRDLLVKAVKINEVPLVKDVLLRNGFTAEDLQDAKITLRTGEGKTDSNDIEISAICCDPKEITIQRTVPSFTK